VPVIAAQMSHLAELAALPAVSLSVIPSAALTSALSYCGLVIYENRSDGTPPIAAIELPYKDLTVEEAPDVEICREWYALLHRSALHGDEAVAFVRDVAASLVNAL
jgi:hypothetical protein